MSKRRKAMRGQTSEFSTYKITGYGVDHRIVLITMWKCCETHHIYVYIYIQTYVLNQIDYKCIYKLKYIYTYIYTYIYINKELIYVYL